MDLSSEKLIGHLKAQSAFKSSNVRGQADLHWRSRALPPRARRAAADDARGGAQMDDLKAALRQGFLDMDRELAQMETFRAERDASGTTAVTVLVSESKIVCANLGP